MRERNSSSSYCGGGPAEDIDTRSAGSSIASASLEHACCREGGGVKGLRGGVKRLRGRVNECIGRSI